MLIGLFSTATFCLRRHTFESAKFSASTQTVDADRLCVDDADRSLRRPSLLGTSSRTGTFFSLAQRLCKWTYRNWRSSGNSRSSNITWKVPLTSMLHSRPTSAPVTTLVCTEPPSAMLWIRSLLRYQRADLKRSLSSSSSSVSPRGNLVSFRASTSFAGILSKMNTRAEKVCASWSME